MGRDYNHQQQHHGSRDPSHHKSHEGLKGNNIPYNAITSQPWRKSSNLQSAPKPVVLPSLRRSHDLTGETSQMFNNLTSSPSHHHHHDMEGDKKLERLRAAQREIDEQLKSISDGHAWAEELDDDEKMDYSEDPFREKGEIPAPTPSIQKEKVIEKPHPPTPLERINEGTTYFQKSDTILRDIVVKLTADMEEEVIPIRLPNRK